MRKQVKHDLLALIQLVPLEKQDVAAALLDEIVFLQSALTQLKAQVKKGADTASIKNYDIVCRRYSALIKQAMDMIPKNATQEQHDALTAFVQDSTNHAKPGPDAT